MSQVASMDESGTSAFLHFGYVPPRRWEEEHRGMFSEFTTSIIQAPPASTLEELVEDGISRWRGVFSDATGELNVIPLSGGMDSRAILGGLLERAGRSRLCTVTFGQAGSLDYELGIQVAEAAGVESIGVDLSSVKLEREQLLALAQTVPPG